MTDATLARAWRERLTLSRARLSELTGDSQQAVYQFERGTNSLGEPHPDAAWQRYKLACLAVATLRHYNVSSVKDWNWA